ncbi:MAG: thiopurine S-methyltransferase [Gammaproteobacteria bacterium]|jgi:thiopurine S-methyltransferase|nr:thiopurine S-methyltransferase [Gammaproteobacteria bacterium]
MENEFWIERWERNQIGFHQAEINTYLKEFWRTLEVPGNGRVFVPLCGKSLDMIWLRAQGHEVLGVEISPIAVRDFFAENDLNPSHRPSGKMERYEADGLSILCGDFFSLSTDDLAGCSSVYDRASLIAFPRDMRRGYAERLKAILPPSTPILLVTLEYPQDEMPGPPFSVAEDEVRDLFESQYVVQRLQAGDALADNKRFRERGLSRLTERIFALSPHEP